MGEIIIFPMGELIAFWQEWQMIRMKGWHKTLARFALALTCGWLLAGCTGGDTGQVKSSPAFPVPITGSLAVVPPKVSINDIYTGKELDKEQVGVQAEMLQFSTHRLLQRQGYSLVPLDKTNDCLKGDFEISQKGNPIGESFQSLPPPAKFACLEKTGATLLVCEDIMAKVGIKKQELGVSADQFNPYYHVRDPSAVSMKVMVYDLKNRQVVWHNEIFQRQNITEDAVANQLLEQVFKSFAPGRGRN